MIVKVIGSNCKNGMQLYKMVTRAIENSKEDIKLEKLDDKNSINKYGVKNIPGLVINEGLVKVTNNTLMKLDETINCNSETYKKIMFIYSSALKEFETKLQVIKDEYRIFHNYNLIDHINTRIKLYESIITKMKKKNINLSYKEMIENIDDIAGMRIICPMRNDVTIIRNLITKFPDIKILEEKDYITTPKKSGYMSYHMLISMPIVFSEEVLFVKIEIQIRTITMDYWSQVEHKKRYKSDKELSKTDTKNLLECVKLINKLDNRMMSLNSIN